jgi:isopentenyldiphosphate isomerase
MSMNPSALRTSEPTKEIIVAVVQLDSKILLLKRSFSARTNPDKWEFVSGMGKADIKDWARFAEDRIRHETGLASKFVKQGKEFNLTDKYGEWLVKPFLFKTTSDDVQVQSEDHDAYRFIEPSEIKEFKCVKDLDKTLKALEIK